LTSFSEKRVCTSFTLGSLICGISANLHHMRATVTISSRGVVTLPAKLRAVLGFKADDALIAEATPEGLLLRPAVTLPVEVYTPQREREFDEAEADLAGALALRGPPPAAQRPVATVRAGRRKPAR
jgi:AbrB family looped-hinge helix DNA binding protein